MIICNPSPASRRVKGFYVQQASESVRALLALHGSLGCTNNSRVTVSFSVLRLQERGTSYTLQGNFHGD